MSGNGAYPGGNDPTIVSYQDTQYAPQQGYQPQVPPYITPIPGYGVAAYTTPPAQNKQNQSTPLIIGALIGVLIVALIVIGFLVFRNLNASDTGRNQAADDTATATVTDTETSQPVPTVTQTVREKPQMQWPPSGTESCTSSVAVNEVTTCEFAYNVVDKYNSGGVGTYNVYSPVTGLWYDITCKSYGSDAAVCTGGKNAAVYIR